MKRKIKVETFLNNSPIEMDERLERYYNSRDVLDVRINVVDEEMNKKLFICTVVYLSNNYTY